MHLPQEELEDVVGLKLLLRDLQGLRPAGGCVFLPEKPGHPRVSSQSAVPGAPTEGATSGLCYQVQPLNAEEQWSLASELLVVCLISPYFCVNVEGVSILYETSSVCSTHMIM